MGPPRLLCLYTRDVNYFLAAAAAFFLAARALLAHSLFFLPIRFIRIIASSNDIIPNPRSLKVGKSPDIIR